MHLNCLPLAVTESQLNKSPVFQWVVVLLICVGGVILIRKGIGGIKHGKITGKRGKTLEGSGAKGLGAVYILIGIFLILLSLGAQIVRTF